MKLGSERWLGHIRELGIFLKWLLYACGIGLLAGAVAAAFHFGIDWATELRGEHPWVVWLAPVGGVAIVLLYRVCHMEKDQGTNLVLVAVREAEPLKLRTAPLIFLSTILTHLVGGSAGREGAALQLGGSLAAWVGRGIGLDDKDRRLLRPVRHSPYRCCLCYGSGKRGRHVLRRAGALCGGLIGGLPAGALFGAAPDLGLSGGRGYGSHPFDHAPGGGAGPAVRLGVYFVL